MNSEIQREVLVIAIIFSDLLGGFPKTVSKMEIILNPRVQMCSIRYCSTGSQSKGSGTDQGLAFPRLIRSAAEAECAYFGNEFVVFDFDLKGEGDF